MSEEGREEDEVTKKHDTIMQMEPKWVVFLELSRDEYASGNEDPKSDG